MANVIISIILIAIVACIIYKMAKNKKQGKSNCGCGCSSCPMSEKCGKTN